MVWEKFNTTVKIAVFLDVTQCTLSEIHWHSCVASLKAYLGPNFSTLKREKRCSLEMSVTVYMSTRPLPKRPKSEHSVHHFGKLNSFWSIQYHFFCGAIAHIGSRSPLFEVSRSHTLRHTTGRTPLNEWSARRRGRYLNNTQQTQQTNNPCPSAGFELAIPGFKRPQTYALDRTATGIG